MQVTQLLEKAGIVNIEKVTLKADPNNINRNRGFAFVEFETNRDAKNAFNRMQKKNIFGRNINIRVDWAQPLIEPAEEEILKVTFLVFLSYFSFFIHFHSPYNYWRWCLI